MVIETCFVPHWPPNHKTCFVSRCFPACQDVFLFTLKKVDVSTWIFGRCRSPFSSSSQKNSAPRHRPKSGSLSSRCFHLIRVRWAVWTKPNTSSTPRLQFSDHTTDWTMGFITYPAYWGLWTHEKKGMTLVHLWSNYNKYRHSDIVSPH